MRILFVHASWDATAEYKIHRILAEHADPEKVDCYFVWQDNTHDRSKNRPANLARPNRNFFVDFGRNMALSPKPSKVGRALLMLGHFPGSMLFLINKVREIQPDVIYTSQQSYEIQLVNLLRRFFRIPHLIHVNYVVGPWLGKSAFQTILQAQHVFACSEFIRQGAIEMGVPVANVDTIWNPADLERFSVPGDRAAIRKEFGWDDQTPIVVAAGRLDPHKGHVELLAAFARVHEQLPDARLLICGSTDTGSGYDDFLKQRAAELGLSEHAIFTGARSDLPAIFAGSDVFCLASENEPFGLVYVEAMATSLPVVALRSGGVPDIVADGETGLLSEPGDVDALATNLLALLSDRERAQRMGAAGKQRALTQFAPTALARRWVDLLYKHFGSAQEQITSAAETPANVGAH